MIWQFQSEERGKEDSNKERFLRPAGSSPCVVVEGGFNVRDQVADPEQGIYHGFYRLGTWICITDRDVWRRSDSILQDGTSYRWAGNRNLNSEKHFSFFDYRTQQRTVGSSSIHRIGERFSQEISSDYASTGASKVMCGNVSSSEQQLIQ